MNELWTYLYIYNLQLIIEKNIPGCWSWSILLKLLIKLWQIVVNLLGAYNREQYMARRWRESERWRIVSSRPSVLHESIWAPTFFTGKKFLAIRALILNSRLLFETKKIIINFFSVVIFFLSVHILRNKKLSWFFLIVKNYINLIFITMTRAVHGCQLLVSLSAKSAVTVIVCTQELPTLVFIGFFC